MYCLLVNKIITNPFKESVGSWSARETVLVKVQEKPNDPSAERIPLAPCQKFQLEKMRVCPPIILLHTPYLYSSNVLNDCFLM